MTALVKFSARYVCFNLLTSSSVGDSNGINPVPLTNVSPFLWTAIVFEHLMTYPIRMGMIFIGKDDGTISCVYNLLAHNDIMKTELGYNMTSNCFSKFSLSLTSDFNRNRNLVNTVVVL